MRSCALLLALSLTSFAAPPRDAGVQPTVKASPEALRQFRAEALRLYRAKRYAEACPVFANVRDADPSDAAAANDWSLCLSKVGKTQEAIAEARRVLGLTADQKLLGAALYNLFQLGVTGLDATGAELQLEQTPHEAPLERDPPANSNDGATCLSSTCAASGRQTFTCEVVNTTNDDDRDGHTQTNTFSSTRDRAAAQALIDGTSQSAGPALKTLTDSWSRVCTGSGAMLRCLNPDDTAGMRSFEACVVAFIDPCRDVSALICYQQPVVDSRPKKDVRVVWVK